MMIDLERERSSRRRLTGWMDVLIGYVRSSKPDLTNRQFALLMLVYLSPGPHTVRAIAARLRVSKPVVTRALNSLGALGYVRRQKDESDLRNVFIERTPQGRAFLEAFAALIEGVETESGNGAEGQRSEVAIHA
jgi:DNA-binding MarR family transcriptional regulator